MIEPRELPEGERQLFLDLEDIADRENVAHTLHQGCRRQLSGARKDSALWMKWVDPQEAEGEHFGVYERILGELA